MDVSGLEEKITPRTAAVMPVHIYGHPVDMDPLRDIARRRSIAVIEDAAEAHGAEVLVGRDTPAPRWVRCGGIGEASCFSFFANKIVTTGEGGMVLTDDDSLAERMRDHRNLHFDRKKKFLHERMGSNYRLTNVQAAIGLAQLERIERFLERKRAMARRYREGLKGLPLGLPAEEPWARNVYWMFGVTLDDAVRADASDFARRLEEKGVQTRPFFIGMHEQPVFHRMGLFVGERYPVCERISRRGFYLPSGQSITDGQIDEVCGAVKAVFGELDG
jgi:perosamine synthetase